MAVYRCMMCGYVFDEAKEGRKFSELEACPACMSDVSMFEPVSEQNSESEPAPEHEPVSAVPASGNKSRYMSEIQWQKQAEAFPEQWVRRCICLTGTMFCC